MTNASTRAAIAEAIRQEIVRQRDEESMAWIDPDAFEDGTTSVQLDGFLDLLKVADAVLAALNPAAADAIGFGAMMRRLADR